MRKTDVLVGAWHAIRHNGETSRSPKTRQITREFGADLPRRIRSIQERLRHDPYEFARQIGATPEKEKGRGKRPLVIAPIEDRIVQRAILDVLQDSPELPDVQNVLATPTSIGGIRGRGVECAIELIEKAYREGHANFVAGSDIAGFFTNIRQSAVVDFIARQTDDTEFVELFRRALKVELANANEIHPKDRALFPTDEVGVAQGCPLSAFAGNVVLQDFDRILNGRGITCIRYIDDFAILGRHQTAVAKAFESAVNLLQALDMSAYRPSERPDKAFFGPINAGHEFLGYQILPGVYPPGKKNRERIVAAVRQELAEGTAHILRALNRDTEGKPLQFYAQTLSAIDKLLRAWSGSFRGSKCLDTANAIDDEINRLVAGFIAFYSEKTAARPIIDRRRALGVHIIADDVRRRLSSRQEISPQ